MLKIKIFQKSKKKNLFTKKDFEKRLFIYLFIIFNISESIIIRLVRKLPRLGYYGIFYLYWLPNEEIWNFYRFPPTFQSQVLTIPDTSILVYSDHWMKKSRNFHPNIIMKYGNWIDHPPQWVLNLAIQKNSLSLTKWKIEWS
jgi:hypothetical protein